MKVIRISGLLSLSAAFGFGAVLFVVSQSVQRAENQLESLHSVIEQERESVEVLSVEWDYLNSPQRLERIAEKLGMRAAFSDQILGHTNSIPEPIIIAPPPVKPQIIPVVQKRFQPKVNISQEPVSSKSSKTFESLLNTLNSGEGL